MVLCKEFVKTRDWHEFNTVELYYSVFHIIGGNKKWYCRVWKGFNYSGAYADNKFDAYRKAVQGVRMY